MKNKILHNKDGVLIEFVGDKIHIKLERVDRGFVHLDKDYSFDDFKYAIAAINHFRKNDEGYVMPCHGFDIWSWFTQIEIVPNGQIYEISHNDFDEIFKAVKVGGV